MESLFLPEAVFPPTSRTSEPPSAALFSKGYGNDGPGTDVIKFKFFSPKQSAKKIALRTQNTAEFCQKVDHNIVFLRKTPFLAQNWQK
jgi:hypothetical protein